MDDLDAPLAMGKAAAFAFPDGSVNGPGLRRLIKMGVLEGGMNRMGFYSTTLRAIRKMHTEAAERGRAPNPATMRVYVVGFGPYVKIGFTAMPLADRLCSLSSGCPEELEVYAEFPGADMTVERALLRRFAAQSTHREWFRYEGELAEWIEAGCPLDGPLGEPNGPLQRQKDR